MSENFGTEIALGISGVYDGSVGSMIGNQISNSGPFGGQEKYGHEQEVDSGANDNNPSPQKPESSAKGEKEGVTEDSSERRILKDIRVEEGGSVTGYVTYWSIKADETGKYWLPLSIDVGEKAKGTMITRIEVVNDGEGTLICRVDKESWDRDRKGYDPMALASEWKLPESLPVKFV